MPQFEVTIKKVIETDDYDVDELHDALRVSEDEGDEVYFEVGRDGEVEYKQVRVVEIGVRKL